MRIWLGLLALVAAAWADAPTAPPLVERPIPFPEERRQLTLDYLRQHVDPATATIEIIPQIVVLHWTGGATADSAWNTFAPVRAADARPELARQGAVNVSAHFLVDRDGTTFRLMPETWAARHCIGLNAWSVGVENVGDGGASPLTDAQVAANVALIRWLKATYPTITHLIGHQEYRALEGTPLFRELDPSYRNHKPDPGEDFLRRVRAEVADLGLLGPTGAAPGR